MALACRISDCPAICLDRKCVKRPVLRYLWDSAGSQRLHLFWTECLVLTIAVCTVCDLFSTDKCSKLVAVKLTFIERARMNHPHMLRTSFVLDVICPSLIQPCKLPLLVYVFASVWFLSSTETKGCSVCVPLYLDAHGCFSAQYSAVRNLVQA